MSMVTEQPEYRVVTQKAGTERLPCWTAEVQCRQAPGRDWYTLKSTKPYISPRDTEATAERWLTDYLAWGWLKATRLMEAHEMRIEAP